MPFTAFSRDDCKCSPDSVSGPAPDLVADLRAEEDVSKGGLQVSPRLHHRRVAGPAPRSPDRVVMRRAGATNPGGAIQSPQAGPAPGVAIASTRTVMVEPPVPA